MLFIVGKFCNDKIYRKEYGMMKRAIIFIAEGFEEIEALTIADILRMADIAADLCSIGEELEVRGAHDIRIKTDIRLKDIKDIESYAAALAPGGMPGAANLRDHDAVIDIFRSFYEREDKLLACICAAPIILRRAGISAQIAGTCYPGFEDEVGYKEYRKEAVVIDKNVVTSMGPASALPLAIKLTELLAGKEKAKEIAEGTLFNDVLREYRK